MQAEIVPRMQVGFSGAPVYNVMHSLSFKATRITCYNNVEEHSAEVCLFLHLFGKNP